LVSWSSKKPTSGLRNGGLFGLTNVHLADRGP
jgi:hypothetical protein